MTRLAILLLCLTSSAAWAQAPLEAPPLPDTGTGWLDFAAKFLPVLWGILGPMATQAMVNAFPKVFRKVPAPVLGVISAVVGAIAGALAGTVDGLVLNAGGVQQAVAAVEGGASATVAHVVAAKVTPGAPKKEQP